MSDNWDQLTTLAQWTDKLEEILDAAITAIEGGVFAERVQVQKRLIDFQRHSPNRFSRTLDEIAFQAVEDIVLGTLEESAQAIGTRTSELSRYVRDLEVVQADVRRAALMISLETPIKIVDSITDMKDAIDGLKEVDLGFSDDKIEDIENKIASAKSALTKLINAVNA